MRVPSQLAYILLLTCLGSSSAVAESYTLEDLVARAAKSPTVAAAREARAAAHAQLRQAQLLWAPSGDLMVNMYGAPDVKCNSIPEGVCLTTSVTDLAHSAYGQPLSERLPIHNFLLGFTVS